MRKPLIIGMGITGQSIARWYERKGIRPQTYDDNAATSVDWDSVTVVHPGPGIPFDHPLYVEARRRGLLIQSDAHIAQEFYPQHRFVGITGSNGKSTTAALLAHLLGEFALLGGNIGIPILDNLPQSSEIHTFVWELSSFQLDIGSSLKFDAAAILNLSPNHLDRHGTMEAYRAAKIRIFEHAQWGLSGINAPEVMCPLWRLGQECFVQQDNIRVGHHTFPFPMQFIGHHNYENAACALAIALHMGQDSRILEERLHTFYPLPHRLELVWQGEWQGKHLRIINDSKSTTAEATRSALIALKGENVWWIGGGAPKEGGISSIVSLFHDVQKSYLIGSAMQEFRLTLESANIKGVVMSDILEKAVHQALADIASSSRTSAALLLSPACASYDQFKNFESRGDVFKDIIRSIPIQAEDGV